MADPKLPKFSVSWKVRPGFVHLDDDHALPREFWITAEPNGAAATLDVVVDERGTPRCTRVEVHDKDGITTETLRGIAVGRLLRFGTTSVLLKVKRTENRVEYAETDHEEKRQFFGRYANARRPRQGSPISDETLEKVATTYREAEARGEPPTKAVAQTMGVSRSTAARWVMRAREKGHLGKARPGRGGEAS